MKFKKGDKVKYKKEKLLKLSPYAQKCLKGTGEVLNKNSGAALDKNKYICVKFPKYPTLWLHLEDLELIKNQQLLFSFMSATDGT